jgi:hypothetical protein
MQRTSLYFIARHVSTPGAAARSSPQSGDRADAVYGDQPRHRNAGISRSASARNGPSTKPSSALSGGFRYPLQYGYAVAGQVIHTGSQVDAGCAGRLVFAFQPHTSHFIARPDELMPIPKASHPKKPSSCPIWRLPLISLWMGARWSVNVIVFGRASSAADHRHPVSVSPGNTGHAGSLPSAPPGILRTGRSCQSRPTGARNI